jgi:hypothetical protein
MKRTKCSIAPGATRGNCQRFSLELRKSGMTSSWSFPDFLSSKLPPPLLLFQNLLR